MCSAKDAITRCSRVLRQEDPVHWHDEPDGGGFWNITRHADLIAVNRDAHVFSSAEHGISIPDIADIGEGAMVREMMLYMDPPRHTRYRLAGEQGVHAADDRAARTAPHGQGHRHRGQRGRRRPMRLRGRHRRRAPAAGHRRAHGGPPGGSPQALRLVQPHDRRRRPRVPEGRRGHGGGRQRRGGAVHVLPQPGRAAPRRPPGRHHLATAGGRDRRATSSASPSSTCSSCC